MLHRSNLLAFVGGGVNPRFSEISGKFILWYPDVLQFGVYFFIIVFIINLYLYYIQFCLSYHNLLRAPLVIGILQSRVLQTFFFFLKFCVICNHSGANFFNFHTQYMYILLVQIGIAFSGLIILLQWSGISADLGWCSWVTGCKRQTGAGVHLHQTCPCCSHEAWQVSSQ